MREQAKRETREGEGARPRRLGPKGAARRDSIMDAAEEVFSERGYYGSSMREVSARSGAALGLIAHYFPSKETLFQEIVARRLPQLLAVVEASLTAAEREAPGDPRAIIRAFIAPFLRACVDDEHGIRYYVRLTSHFMSAYRVPEIGPALASLSPVSDLLFSRLRAAIPHLTDPQFEIGVYLIEAALIFMVQDMGFLNALSAGDFDTSRIDAMIEPAATFFAAGTRALGSLP